MLQYADLATEAGAKALNDACPRAKLTCKVCGGSGRYARPGYPPLEVQEREIAQGRRETYVQAICSCIRS
jgi:hypothetical protein